MTFSERTNWDLQEHELATAVTLRRSLGKQVIDLTVSNPTACGFDYSEAFSADPLLTGAALSYDAIPFGIASARQAVTTYYADAGAVVPPKNICLTTSTSEAYSYLFRLLCDPGDEVLVARPTYPLFDYIARLDSVVLREYPLHEDPHADEHFGWTIDLHALEAAITARTRAILLVHPNNPTGNFASFAEQDALREICSSKGIALIVDEVFLDYPVEERRPSFTVGPSPCLTFVLSGLSKVCGLPQMKISWIVAAGPDSLVHPALARLEIIADTFLSVNTPVQLALPGWLDSRHFIQDQVRTRMEANLSALDARLCGTSAQRLAMQAGWTALVRVPRTVKGIDFVEAALDRGVLVQPGPFYGLPQGRIAVSLLTPTHEWARGLAALPIDAND